MDDGCKIKPLSIIFPKTSGYVKLYDGQTKQIHVQIEDDELLKKYNDIWNKLSNSIKSKADKLIYSKKFFDVVPKKDENYYTKLFLKECKDVEKKMADQIY